MSVVLIGAISHYNPVTYFSVHPIPPPDYFKIQLWVSISTPITVVNAISVVVLPT